MWVRTGCVSWIWWSSSRLSRVVFVGGVTLDVVPNMAIPNLEIVMDVGSSDLGWAVFRDGKMVVIPVVLDRGKMQLM